jgi:hypothetical protein
MNVYVVFALQCPLGKQFPKMVGVFKDLDDAKAARDIYIKGKRKKVLFEKEQGFGMSKLYDLKINQKKIVRWIVQIRGPMVMDTIQ